MAVGGATERFEIRPQDYAISQATADDIRGGSPEENAEIVRSVLAGQVGAQRDIVVLNAGAAIWVADASRDLAEGVDRAKQSIDSDAARQKLEALITATRDADAGALA